MNQTVPGLDPKLAETYNRVMGTPTTPAAPTKPAGPQAPHVTAAPSPTAPSPTTTYVSSKKRMPWWIFLVLGVVFFAGYTFFWINTFGLSLF